MPETEWLTLLGVGFLLGLRHALETDHLAAVSTVLVERPSLLASGAVGLWWGIGHTLTLLLVGSAILTCGLRISSEFEMMAESGVALLLIVLGVTLARKLYRERWHIHRHHHDDKELHVHFHNHRRHLDHGHGHRHWVAGSMRPFCIGMAHGLAGSAALMLMILATTHDVSAGILSILLFGVGSIIGMMVIGVTISLPAVYSRSVDQRLLMAVQGLASLASVSVGAWMLVNLTMSAVGH